MQQLAVALWLPLVFGRVVSAQGAACYNAFGTPIPWDIEPCDQSATGTAGSHSACCNTKNNDACLSSGLCLATWGNTRDNLLWIGGCTDRTWQDPACSRLCAGNDRTGNDRATSYHLMACSNSTWCCAGVFDFQDGEAPQEECCKNAFKLPEGVGTVVLQFSAGPKTRTSTTTGSSTATPTGTSPNPTSDGDGPAATCDSNSAIGATGSTGDGSDSKIVAIVGGVLGTLLAASLVAVAMLGFNNRKLRKQIQQGAAAAGTETTNYHGSKTSPSLQPGFPGIPHTATELSATDRTPELDASQRLMSKPK